jgi:peroxiredoxin
MGSVKRLRTRVPPLPDHGRSRLRWIAAVGLCAVSIALAAVPGLRFRRLVAQLDGDEHEIGAPKEALIGVLGPRALPFFRGLLEAPADGARLAAVDFLLESRKEEALPRLAPLLADHYSLIRQRIMEAAERMSGPEARGILLAGVADEDTWVREIAVAGLASRVQGRSDRSPGVLAALARAVDDPSLAVVGTAMSAMRAAAGIDFGYRTRLDDRDRARAVARWQQWWKQQAPHPLPALPPPVAITHTASAPGFSFRDVEGRRWTLSGLRGKAVLLNFFGTWCSACQDEMAHLQKLHEEKGPALVVLGAAVAEKGPGEVRTYARRRGLTFPLALAPDRLREAYGHVHDVPVTYLIDGEGRIRRRFDGDRDWSTFAKAAEAVMKSS